MGRLARVTVIVSAAWMMLCIGCGEAQTPTARLAGEVTLAGEPIAEGKVTFLPQGDSTGAAVSADIKHGRYAVADVPRGKVKAMITATRATGKMITDYSEPFPERVNIVPPQYQPGFDLEVTGDSDAQNFSMSSP